MDEERARQLGSEVAGWYLHADLGERAAHLIDTAVSMLTREFIPDEAVVAVSEGEPQMPLITATDSEALYLVDVPEPPDGPVRHRSLPLSLALR